MKKNNQRLPFVYLFTGGPEQSSCPHCGLRGGPITSTSLTTGCCEHQVYLYLQRKFSPAHRPWERLCRWCHARRRQIHLLYLRWKIGAKKRKEIAAAVQGIRDRQQDCPLPGHLTVHGTGSAYVHKMGTGLNVTVPTTENKKQP